MFGRYVWHTSASSRLNSCPRCGNMSLKSPHWYEHCPVIWQIWQAARSSFKALVELPPVSFRGGFAMANPCSARFPKSGNYSLYTLPLSTPSYISYLPNRQHPTNQPTWIFFWGFLGKFYTQAFAWRDVWAWNPESTPPAEHHLVRYPALPYWFYFPV